MPPMELQPLEIDFRLALVLMAAAGLLYCFLGYRLFRLVLGITGFALAGAVAALFVGWLLFGHPLAMALAFLLGGLCGAMALFFLYRTGVFLLGFLGALVVAYQLLSARPEAWGPWAIVGAALAGGLLALALERPAMKLATAAIGAWLCTYAIAFMAWGESAVEPWTDVTAIQGTGAGVVALWAFLTLLGAVFQWQVFRGPRRPAAA
jgi:hypothetical protein